MVCAKEKSIDSWLQRELCNPIMLLQKLSALHHIENNSEFFHEFVSQVLLVLINVCFCFSSSMCRQVVIDMDTGKQILHTPVVNVTVKITAEPGTIASIVSASLLRSYC